MSSDSFIETRSGKHFTLKNFHPDMLDADDITFALSNLCRYTGHCRFYSVAEHSVLVASVMRPELRLVGLLHDAAEAYLADLNPMIKQAIPMFRVIEHELQTAIYKEFSGHTPTVVEYKEIKYADRCVLKTEGKALFLSQGKNWLIDEPPAMVVISCWPPDKARLEMTEQWNKEKHNE